jgi:mono/diheme cytochrome c family protein
MGWLASALWNHSPGMWQRMGGSPPGLGQEAMAHLLAFLYNAGTGDRPGDPAAGKRIFAEKGCARCHQQIAAHDPGAWMQAMWNHAQSMGERVRHSNGDWPEFIGEEMNDLMAFAGGDAVPAPAPGPESALRGSADRGWVVFERKCIRCHSVNGNGGRIGPEFGPDHELPHSAAQFATVLWNHAPSMLKHAREASVTMPTLEGAEIRDVQTFLISLQYYEPSGSRFVGRRVFAERGCARCHGNSAEGTAGGPRLRAGGDAYTTISLATALWTHGPEMRARAERIGIAWPALQSTDIGDLISFLNDPR